MTDIKSDIKRVDVDRSEEQFGGYYSQPLSNPTQLNAPFCYQFQVCYVLYYGTVKVEYVQTENVKSKPDLLEMVRSTTMGVFSYAEGKAMRVRVTMKDGTVFEHTEPDASIMREYTSLLQI